MRISPRPLTHVQKQILEYIEQSIEKTGISPSYREVMEALGYKSTGAVYRLIEILKKKGHLAPFTPQRWRSFSPLTFKQIEPVVDIESKKQAAPIPSTTGEKESLHFSLEIIGMLIGSKPPQFMREVKTLLLPKSSFPQISSHKQKLYGLIIQDSSFLSEYLLPGDIIIVEPTIDEIKPDELVLATTPEESLIGYCSVDKESFQFKSNPYSNAGLLQKMRKRPSKTTQIWGVIHGSLRGFTL